MARSVRIARYGRSKAKSRQIQKLARSTPETKDKKRMANPPSLMNIQKSIAYSENL
jgi:hypothetical protein